MTAFSSFHPLVNFIYFVCAIGFSCFFMHPISLFLSLAAGITEFLIIRGRKGWKLLLCMCSAVPLTALINAAFNHRGVTVLFYFGNGNPITAESVLYGIAAGTMLLCVILHFHFWNAIMTSDKIICLFGNILPTLSLVFSMTLRFIPRFYKYFSEAAEMERCMGGKREKKFFRRVRQGLRLMSMVTTRAIENAVETADSMRARGYGLPKRTAFSVFRFQKKDAKLAAFLLFTAAAVWGGKLFGGAEFMYFPAVSWGGSPIWTYIFFTAYGMLLACPLFIEMQEVRKWKALRSGM